MIEVFQHCSAEITRMEPTLRSAQVLKQEAEEIGLQGKEIAEYVTRQQNLDREERAAWRVAQKFHAEEKKRADEIRMAEIAAEAEEKKRADEIRFAQIEAEKELKIKEMELQAQQAQAQVTASSATTPPPRNKDAKSPKLPSLPFCHLDKYSEVAALNIHCGKSLPTNSLLPNSKFKKKSFLALNLNVTLADFHI